jgi:aminopeptidase N
VAKDEWNHVKITFLYPPERKYQVARQLKAVKYALDYLSRNVGPYPWPHLTFVDPPSVGNGAGGMEYTTIFTSMSSDIMPAWLHMPEMVTIHEFGHAYFMGILASNEFEEPWLDEGVNSFWEERIMDHYYGPEGGMLDLPFLKINDQSIGRSSYVASGSRQAVSNGAYSWKYPHGTYSMMSYQKTATWLYTMMGIIGEQTTNKVFQEYYRQWAFKYPSGRDFITVVNNVVTDRYGEKFGKDMNWFFDQTTYGTGICDYKVNSFYNIKNRSFEGVRFEGDSVKMEIPDLKKDTTYTSTVELERVGDMMLPVEVLVHFNNGDRVREKWDGKSRVKDYIYTGTRKVDWVKIDPEYKITMDVNYINNSMTSNPDAAPVKRIADKLLIFMEFFIHIFSL